MCARQDRGVKRVRQGTTVNVGRRPLCRALCATL